MPLVQITLFPGRSAETKEKLGAEITRVLTEVAGIPAKDTTILFSDLAPENWVVAGKPLGRPD